MRFTLTVDWGLEMCVAGRQKVEQPLWGVRLMKQDEYTDMGGTGEVFLTTHWSLIGDIGSADDRDRALIGLLINKYWKPVYCYLRRKGYDNEEAKDLTQGFFHQVVLGRNLFQKADQSRGRFRSFLLMALNRYLISAREKQTAQRQIPKHKLVSLDQIDLPELAQTTEDMAPEDAYNYAWVSALLEEVLVEVQAQCRERRLYTHWQIFRERVLKPILRGGEPTPMREICEKYGIEDGIKASNMVTTVKRIFQTTLRQYVRNSVISNRDLQGNDGRRAGGDKAFFSEKERRIAKILGIYCWTPS